MHTKCCSQKEEIEDLKEVKSKLDAVKELLDLGDLNKTLAENLRLREQLEITQHELSETQAKLKRLEDKFSELKGVFS